MNQNYALEAKDLMVGYGGVKAVDGVTLKLAVGEIKGLIGPNGAGKSTLIDAISGRRNTHGGSVTLGGHSLDKLDIVQRRQRGLSRSFQRTSVFPNMRVRDQVALAAHQVGSHDVAADTDEVLGELDLTRLSSAFACDLGYGEQRRLDLALALVGGPSVLLLDEPMAGLSIKESQVLAGHLQHLTSRRNVSVLLVEHDMEIVFGISASITVLELGRVLAEGTPDTIRANPRVRQAYLGSAA